MNPIQVHCPECQKLFYVNTTELAVGQARFQCSACKSFFAFNWPQPADATVVRAQKIERVDKEAPSTRACIRCGAPVDANLKECPKCGIVFDKAKKLQSASASMPPAGPELLEAWEAVKANYQDPKRHEGFIQLCLNRGNLAFASFQYRSILAVSPAEETANKMQSRIIQLATVSAMTAEDSSGGNASRGRIFLNALVVLGGLLIFTGMFMKQANSLIAVGVSIVVFVVTFRYFSR